MDEEIKLTLSSIYQGILRMLMITMMVITISQHLFSDTLGWALC